MIATHFANHTCLILSHQSFLNKSIHCVAAYSKIANDLQPCRSAEKQLQVGTFMYRPGAISHSTLIVSLIWSHAAFISLHKTKGESPTDQVLAGAIRHSWGTFCHVCWARSLCREESQPTRPDHMLRSGSKDKNWQWCSTALRWAYCPG